MRVCIHDASQAAVHACTCNNVSMVRTRWQFCLDLHLQLELSAREAKLEASRAEAARAMDDVRTEVRASAI